MKITSSAFLNNEMIPARYTCDGQNISPPLEFDSVPENTKSLILIVEDPDAPRGTFTHWIMYNIPADKIGLSENIPAGYINGSVQGKNDFGKVGYGGPCPPDGTHRYYFKLYALDTMLNIDTAVTKQNLETAMQSHIKAVAELIGLYKRKTF